VGRNSTSDLIQRLKAGDPEALNRWLGAIREKLIQWTAITVGVPAARGAEAADLVQEATLYLSQRIRDFRGTTESELIAWLHQILRCRAIDLSRRRVLQTVGLRSASTSRGPAVNQLVADLSTPSQQAIRNEHEQRILSAAADLADDELLIVLLREVDDCRLKVIARELGRPPILVARLYLQGVQKLSDILQYDPLVESAQSESRTAKVRTALQRLPERQRQAVELKHVEEYSLEEIAVVLGCEPCTIEAAGSLVYRGMTKLKGLLKD
jgi:RNA polymerase sigma factor (sigma-70 family)